MAKNRSTHQKREREFEKRQRAQRKADKAAEKRDRKFGAKQEQGTPPGGKIAVAPGS